MELFLGNRCLVVAEQEDREDRPGYRFVEPDGSRGWMPARAFELQFRPLTRHERTLFEQTDAEHRIAAISDVSSGLTAGEDQQWPSTKE